MIDQISKLQEISVEPVQGVTEAKPNLEEILSDINHKVTASMHTDQPEVLTFVQNGERVSLGRMMKRSKEHSLCDHDMGTKERILPGKLSGNEMSKELLV